MSDRGKESNSLEKSITGSELRYIFRNWNDPSYQENIRFYKRNSNNSQFEVVQPPWVENPEEWQDYTPKKWYRNQN